MPQAISDLHFGYIYSELCVRCAEKSEPGEQWYFKDDKPNSQLPTFGRSLWNKCQVRALPTMPSEGQCHKHGGHVSCPRLPNLSCVVMSRGQRWFAGRV